VGLAKQVGLVGLALALIAAPAFAAT